MSELAGARPSNGKHWCVDLPWRHRGFLGGVKRQLANHEVGDQQSGDFLHQAGRTVTV